MLEEENTTPIKIEDYPKYRLTYGGYNVMEGFTFIFDDESLEKKREELEENKNFWDYYFINKLKWEPNKSIPDYSSVIFNFSGTDQYGNIVENKIPGISNMRVSYEEIIEVWGRRDSDGEIKGYRI